MTNINDYIHSMKRITKHLLTVLTIILASATITSAQESSLPKYRAQGYKGNVGIVGECLWYFVGVETSHGYMFDEHTYLGIGARASYFLLEGGILPVNAYLEWRTYTSKVKENTPIIGIKAGYGYYPVVRDNNLLLEPNIGWSWSVKGGHGLTLELGCPLYWGIGQNKIESEPQPSPKISIEFEF